MDEMSRLMPHHAAPIETWDKKTRHRKPFFSFFFLEIARPSLGSIAKDGMYYHQVFISISKYKSSSGSYSEERHQESRLQSFTLASSNLLFHELQSSLQNSRSRRSSATRRLQLWSTCSESRSSRSRRSDFST